MGGGGFELPPDRPLTLAAYLAEPLPEAYVEPVAVGGIMPDMPVFLNADRYVNVPLEETYMTAYRGVPEIVREMLDVAES